jgi:hypothetical protein
MLELFFITKFFSIAKESSKTCKFWSLLAVTQAGKSITFFCKGDGEGMVHFGMAPSPPARQLVAPPAGGTPPSQRALCVCDVGSERRSFSSVYTSPLFVGTAEKKGIPWLFCSIAVWFRIRVPPALFCLLMCWATGKRALS